MDTEKVYYRNFSIGSEAQGYPMHLSGYDEASTYNDMLSFHNNMKFSAADRDNDLDRLLCAVLYPGGWWFKGGPSEDDYCSRVHLNKRRGPEWGGARYSSCAMMIRYGTD